MVDQSLPWRRLYDLHVVRHLRAVARRRGLDVGFWDAAGAGEAPHAHGDLPSLPSLCSRLVDEGERCFEHASSVGTRLAPGQPWTVLGCHAGLREIAVPIERDGVTVGALLIGGFRETGAVPIGDGVTSAAWDATPMLDAGQVALLGEMAAAVAADVALALAELTAPPPSPVRQRYDAIIGGSPKMQELYTLLDRVVRSESTVLIQGENGTGKELVARAIHNGSDRRDRRFVVTNCSAFNDNLLDSELFGHKRGAFTGAVADKPGLFEVADTGTFFLDEIGDMSPTLQVKVLRVLQEGTFNRVGDTETRKVDVRIIAATNRDLRAMVARGQFREDLYYRINVINLMLPALRERREDIPLLLGFFLDRQRRGGKGKRLADDCVARMTSYPWPGNVRELENEVERLVVLSGDDPVIEEDLLSTRIRHHSAPIVEEAVPMSSLPDAVEALERRMIVDALRRNRWNKTRASSDLKVSRRNLIRLVQKYGIEPPAAR